MRFNFGGKEYNLRPEEVDADKREQVAAEATFFAKDGTPLEGLALERVRHRMAGTYGDRLPPNRFYERREGEGEEPLWLIPGLWLWGTIVMLIGQPFAGKSIVIADLMKALHVAGSKFLGKYGADLSADERYKGELLVWLIDSENDPVMHKAELRAIGIDPNGEATWPVTDYLVDQGDAQSFDLRDPATYAYWEFRFGQMCEECGGSDDFAPSVVVVDNITTILGGDTSGYAEWYHAFTRLMRKIRCPNALVVTHSTLKGDHVMGGIEPNAGPRATWNYSMADPDNPFSQRYFSVMANMGAVSIPKAPVDLVDGRPIMGAARKPRAAAHEADQPRVELDEVVDAFVVANPECSARNIREGVTGRGPDVDAARDRLVASGRIAKQPSGRQGGGYAYRAVEQNDPATGGNDSK